MNVLVCPCGSEFSVPDWKLKVGRGKYCSQSCKYKYRVRPSGLTYDIKVENSAWIKPGQRLSPETEFQPGQTPHNWQGGRTTWKPSPPEYVLLHNWVRFHLGSARRRVCRCGSPAEQWANLSHEYRKDLSDFEAMCIPCHIAYDKGHKGAIARSFA